MESARRQEEIAIGYRIMAEKNNQERAHGIVLNPSKSEVIHFANDDKVIVLTEEKGS